jgi:transcriptional regulator with XRE-family HTH domain
MPHLSPTVQALLDRIQKDPEGARNLYRAQRMAGLSRQLREAAEHRHLSVRALAQLMGTSASQAQRLLSMTSPANVTLDTLFRAADAMGVEVDLRLRDNRSGQYYTQRSNFPTFREVTCLQRNVEPSVRRSEAPQSQPLVSASVSGTMPLGGRYGATG